MTNSKASLIVLSAGQFRRHLIAVTAHEKSSRITSESNSFDTLLMCGSLLFAPSSFPQVALSSLQYWTGVCLRAPETRFSMMAKRPKS